MVENIAIGTGRRKTAVARVFVRNGSGKIVVNGKDVNDYMPFAVLVMDLKIFLVPQHLFHWL